MSLRADYALALRRRGLSPATLHKRDQQIAAFAAWLDAPLSTATARDVEAFLDTRQHGSRTRYSWLSNLSCFYAWCEREGHVDRNPVVRIDRPKLRPLLPRPITDGDLAVAFSAADRRMSAWLHLAAYGGLRCAEIAWLDADCVLTHERLLRVLGKGSKERLVPMHPLVAASLEAWGIPRAGPVFRGLRGRLKPSSVSRTAALYFHGLGLAWTLHTLRHWFGTHTYAACTDLRAVQELLGHASPQTTAVYVAFSRATARAAVEALTLQPAREEVTL